MNWEQLLKNIGACSGLIVLMTVWLGQAIWMQIEAEKRGMTGWVWALIGVVTPPFGLFYFLITRVRHQVLPQVAERDLILKEAAEKKLPVYQVLKEWEAGDRASYSPDQK